MHYLDFGQWLQFRVAFPEIGIKRRTQLYVQKFYNKELLAMMKLSPRSVINNSTSIIIRDYEVSTRAPNQEIVTGTLPKPVL